MTDLVTINPDQLPQATAVPEGAQTMIWSEGGPLQRLPYRALLAKLISTDLIKSDRAALYADLAWDADKVALVHNDPVAEFNGWYRKAGASGAGEWSQFEELARSVRAAAELALSQAQQWAEGTLPGGAGTKSAKEHATDAAASATALNAIVEAIDPAPTPDLFTFKDAADNIVGKVGADASWDILLKKLATAAGLTVEEVDTVDEASPFVVLDADEKVLYEAPPTGTVTESAEVIAARGSRASVDERISQTLDAYGSPHDNFNAMRFRRWRYKFRKRLLGEAVQHHKGMFGDSFTHNRTRYSGDLAATLIAEMGDAGGGWTGFGFITGSPAGPYAHGGTQPSLLNGNVRSTYGVSLNGNWTGAYATVPSPDTCCAISSTAGEEIRATFPAAPALSGVDLFWIGTADGVMKYSWDGVTWTNINVQGTVGACSFASLAGVPGAGAGTLYLQVVSGTCKPAGVNWKSAASGIVVHKLAATGSRMAQLATQAAVASWRTAVAALGLDSAVVMHGTNDQGASSSPTQFATDTETVLSGLAAAITGIDLMIAMPAENQRVGMAYPMTAYKAAASAVAAAHGVAFQDDQRAFGDPDNPTEYGYAGATPLFNSDLTHPEPQTGGRVILENRLRFFNSL